MRFHDRAAAGLQLAERLIEYGNRSDVIVLALPSGGVPVASEVAKRLRVPLDVFLVRKLGVPGRGHAEFIAADLAPLFPHAPAELLPAAFDSILVHVHLPLLLDWVCVHRR